jgi:polysaccharide export outer membrane protein
MRNNLAVIIILLAVMAGASAATPDSDGQPTPANPQADVDESYALQTGDVIRITVFNEPDLSVEAKVDPQGNIVLPLLGAVSVAGNNVRQVEQLLENKYIEEELLVAPQVSAVITQFTSQVFYLFGEVNSPGAKAIPPGKQYVGILEAITMGGDLTQFARRREILLRRPDPAGGAETRIQIDLDHILRGERGSADPTVRVFPGDIIFVPERLF